MKPEFWKNKRVLITGNNGFKGTWLMKWLDIMGAEIVGISLKADAKNGFDKLNFSEKCYNYEIDLRNIDDLSVIQTFSPEIVIHLAAQAIVKTAKECPVDTFSTNVMGTANLLEVLRCIPSVKSIVVVTSDKVYENKEKLITYTEKDNLMGSEPYSCSKVAEEQVTRAYYESYFKELGVGIATARASNAFGGGDYHFDRLIPYLEKCAYKKVIPEIRNPNAIRPWQYVLDLLAGYMTLAERLYSNPNIEWESYNFGPDKEDFYTVGQMADIICGKTIETIDRQDFYESGVLMIASDKSKKELGWETLYNLKDGLEQTNLSYAEYFKNGNSDIIYHRAIKNYMDRR